MITNVNINQGLKVPVVPGQNNHDAITVGFTAEATEENISKILMSFGSSKAARIKINDLEFEALLEKDQFVVTDIKKFPRMKFRLSCYHDSADTFMSLMGKVFNIEIL